MKARNLLIGAATATTMSVLVGSAPVRAGSDEPCGFIGVDVGSKAELLEQGYTPAALYAMGDRDSSAFGEAPWPSACTRTSIWRCALWRSILT